MPRGTSRPGDRWLQREAALAAARVIAVVEELVNASVVRDDPNRTVLPGTVVDAVCVEPFGAHPSFAQGHYDRDNAFYRDWDPISRDPARSRPGSTSGYAASTGGPLTSSGWAREDGEAAPRPGAPREASTTGATGERGNA